MARKATKKKAPKKKAPKKKSRSVAASAVDGARLALQQDARANALDLATNPNRGAERALVERECARLGLGRDVFRVPPPRPPRPAPNKLLTEGPLFGSLPRIKNAK